MYFSFFNLLNYLKHSTFMPFIPFEFVQMTLRLVIFCHFFPFFLPLNLLFSIVQSLSAIKVSISLNMYARARFSTFLETIHLLSTLYLCFFCLLRIQLHCGILSNAFQFSASTPELQQKMHFFSFTLFLSWQPFCLWLFFLVAILFTFISVNADSLKQPCDSLYALGDSAIYINFKI